MSNPAASATTKHTYVQYREDLERPATDEDNVVTKIIKSLRRNNEWAFKKYKHGIRDAHAKSHGILRGEMKVYSDLPEHLRQGLFATPTTYPVIARVSSTHPAIRPDKIRGVRAVALKVLNVEGERLSPDGVHTQDFVLVNHSEFPYADAKDYYKKGMPAARVLARLPDTALWVLTEVLAAVQRVLALFGGRLPGALTLFTEPNNLVLGETFHSAAPLPVRQVRGQAQFSAVLEVGAAIAGPTSAAQRRTRRASRNGHQLLLRQQRGVRGTGTAMHKYRGDADRGRDGPVVRRGFPAAGGRKNHVPHPAF